MIIQAVTRSDFCQAFARMGRSDQFSADALDLLYDYLDDLSDQGGKPYKLDVVGICCEYVEQPAAEIASSNPDAPQRAEHDDDDEHAEAVAEWLRDQTQVVGITSGGGIVYADY